MIIKPRVRGFICVTAHPVGCEANVKEQIDYVTQHGAIAGGPKKVLVLGASTGYGLAARISAAFGCGADTLGVFFEKEGEEGKLSSAGWYNSAAFEKFAVEKGLYAKSINGDAFSDEIKRLTIETIKKDLGKIDLVVYSLAAPRRTDPQGVVHTSTLKPIGKAVTLRGINTDKGVVVDTTLEPATQEEIDGTVKVMGGEDWQLWIDALRDADVLAEGAKTTAFTYLGEKLTQDIYWNGSIGEAKKDLDKKSPDPARQPRGAQGRCPCVGAQGRGYPGELGDPDHAAVPVVAVQSDERAGHPRRLHRAGLRLVQGQPVRHSAEAGRRRPPARRPGRAGT